MAKKKKTEERPVSPEINDSELIRESWKIFQIMAEFVEGFERLVHIKPSVSIFGSARVKPGTTYYQLAEETAELLSNEGYSVVTGGGPGIMEAGNKGAFKGKSFSVGLNIALPFEAIYNEYQDISLRFRHYFTRKVMFVKYAAAYIVMPGGYGTLDEMAEILTLMQTKKTRQIPVILVNTKYWNPLIQWFKDTLLAEGMIDKEDLKAYEVVDTPQEVLDCIKKFYKGRDLSPTEQERDIMNKSL